MSCAMNPRMSRPRLATNRHCRNMRTTRPGSTPENAPVPCGPAGRLAARTAMACMTAATP